VVNDRKKVILYGAGRNAGSAYTLLKEYLELVCFADQDEDKQGTELIMPDGRKIPVLTLVNAIELAEFIYVTIVPPLLYKVISDLINIHNIEERVIINNPYNEKFKYSVSPVLWSKLYSEKKAPSYRKSCQQVESQLIIGDKGIQACCSTDPSVFSWSKDASSQQLYNKLLGFKREVITAVSNDCIPYCKNCYALKEKEWGNNIESVESVSIGTGSICQFNCIYCKGINDQTKKDWETNIAERIERLNKDLDFIEYLKTVNYIHDNTEFFIVNGEITINPLRSRIYNIIKGYKCTFLTNAEVFSEEIADSMSNGESVVNVSLDAGTKESYATIKGKDCFNKVISNIEEYSKRGNIILKFIVMPGINTNDNDAKGFIDFAIKIGATVEISINFLDVQKFDRNIDICIDTIKKIAYNARANGLTVINRVEIAPNMRTENRKRINDALSFKGEAHDY